jgi:hypothetical protein
MNVKYWRICDQYLILNQWFLKVIKSLPVDETDILVCCFVGFEFFHYCRL